MPCFLSSGGTHLSLPQPSTGFLCLPGLGGCLSRLASRLLPGSMVSHLTTACDKGPAQSCFVQPTKGHFCSVLGASHRLDMPGRPQPGGGTSLGNSSPALAGTWGLGTMPATGFPGSWTHRRCLLSMPMQGLDHSYCYPQLCSWLWGPEPPRSTARRQVTHEGQGRDLPGPRKRPAATRWAGAPTIPSKGVLLPRKNKEKNYQTLSKDQRQ